MIFPTFVIGDDDDDDDDDVRIICKPDNLHTSNQEYTVYWNLVRISANFFFQ